MLKMNKFTAISLGVLALGTVTVGGVLLNTAAEVASVAHKEFNPQELLRKYEWFKDAASTLDKKRADISVYQGRISSLNMDYEGVKRIDWPRSDREALNQWRSEVAGVTASFNSLASEYNSQMSKFNWNFTNVGSLPKGATEVLPREFKSYLGE